MSVPVADNTTSVTSLLPPPLVVALLNEAAFACSNIQREHRAHRAQSRLAMASGGLLGPLEGFFLAEALNLLKKSKYVRVKHNIGTILLTSM